MFRKNLLFGLLIISLIIPFVSSLGIDCNGYHLGLNFCYSVEYEVQHCSKLICYNPTNLPKEGDDIVYWPKIIITGFRSYVDNPLNESYHPGNLELVYYFQYPSGEESQRNSIFISDPEINLSSWGRGPERIVLNSSYAIGGFNLPTNHPGVMEIKYAIISSKELPNINSINASLFDTERIHVLSYNEYIIEKLTGYSFLVSILALITAIISTFIPLYRDKRRQIALLKSLYSELDALSSKKKKIKLLNKEISTVGNIQWAKELFEGELKPAHNLWRLNTKIYVSELNDKINHKRTKELKDALIHISQKIELIETHLNSTDKIPKGQKDMIKEILMNICDEVIGLIETTKEYLSKEFKIRG